MPAPALTWEQLVAREPALARLRREVEAVEDEGGRSFCANKVWYIQFEPHLTKLAGRRATGPDPLLRTPQAYEVARATLYELLPDCRNCICLPW